MSTRLAECAGTVHLPPLSPGSQTIRWYAARPDKARPVAWTCPDCHDPEYELCTLGGLWFIRRGGRETVRDTRVEAERVWGLLVAGAAR